MLYEFSQIMNKRYRIPTRQSRMDHPEKPASFGFTRHGRRKSKLSTRNNTKNSNMAPTKTSGSESKCSRLFYPFYQKKLEIAKQSSFSCNISIFYPLTFNTDERRVGIPLIDLAPPYLYGCPNLVPRFPTTYGIIVFSELR